MILAGTAYDHNDVRLTAEWLNKVPEEQRGWAWRHLRQQSQGGLFTLRGHKHAPTSVAFSPDGKKLVTTGGSISQNRSDPAEVKVWDARTGELLLELKDVPSATSTHGVFAIGSVAFSPDGRKIVTGAGERRIRIGGRSVWKVGPVKVWDAETGKILLELREGIENPVASVAFSPDGRRIATGMVTDDDDDQAGPIRVWDAEMAGKPLLELKGLRGSVTSLAFRPDGKQLATLELEPGTLKIWDAEKGGRPLRVLNGIATAYTSVAFSPDGKRIVAGNRDGTATVLDAESGEVLLRLKGQARVANAGTYGVFGITSAAFSPDGSRIVTGGGSGQSARSGDLDLPPVTESSRRVIEFVGLDLEQEGEVWRRSDSRPSRSSTSCVKPRCCWRRG